MRAKPAREHCAFEIQMQTDNYMRSCHDKAIRDDLFGKLGLVEWTRCVCLRVIFLGVKCHGHDGVLVDQTTEANKVQWEQDQKMLAPSQFPSNQVTPTVECEIIVMFYMRLVSHMYTHMRVK